MSIFDPFNQAKLQNGYSKLKNTTLPEKDISLDDLKRLSGSGQVTNAEFPEKSTKLREKFYCIVATKQRPLDIK